MSPASGPVHDAKLFPAAVQEDQEALVEGKTELTEIGPAPFSSPDPQTDAIKMLPLEDGTSSAYDARKADQARHSDTTDYKSMSPDELKSLAEERGLKVKGTGANGNVKKSDLVEALTEDDTKDMKAGDWKDQISAAADQDALDEVLDRYEASGADYSTVETAAEKRQKEIDEAAESDGNGQ